MKSKVIGKKLALNKETIADLKTGKMREVYGGGDVPQLATPPVGCTGTCLSYCTGGEIVCPC